MKFEADLGALSVSVGMPCGPDVPWKTMASLVETFQTTAVQGISCELNVVAGASDVVAARDQVIGQFLAGSCNRLFWIDSDIVFTPADFFRLLALSTKMDVVCATYPVKRSPVIFPIRHENLRDFEQNDYGCIKILGAGLGFTVLTREAVERVVADKPRILDGRSQEYISVFRRDTEVIDGRTYGRGEDNAFFADLRGLGYDVWLDPTIQLGHVGIHTFRGDPINALKLERVYREGA